MMLQCTLCCTLSLVLLMCGINGDKSVRNSYGAPAHQQAASKPVKYAGPIVYTAEKPPIIHFPPPPAKSQYNVGGNGNGQSIKYVPLPYLDLPVLIYQSKHQPPIHVVHTPKPVNPDYHNEQKQSYSTPGKNTKPKYVQPRSDQAQQQGQSKAAKYNPNHQGIRPRNPTALRVPAASNIRHVFAGVSEQHTQRRPSVSQPRRIFDLFNKASLSGDRKTASHKAKKVHSAHKSPRRIVKPSVPVNNKKFSRLPHERKPITKVSFKIVEDKKVNVANSTNTSSISDGYAKREATKVEAIQQISAANELKAVYVEAPITAQRAGQSKAQGKSSTYNEHTGHQQPSYAPPRPSYRPQPTHKPKPRPVYRPSPKPSQAPHIIYAGHPPIHYYEQPSFEVVTTKKVTDKPAYTPAPAKASYKARAPAYKPKAPEPSYKAPQTVYVPKPPKPQQKPSYNSAPQKPTYKAPKHKPSYKPAPVVRQQYSPSNQRPAYRPATPQKPAYSIKKVPKPAYAPRKPAYKPAHQVQAPTHTAHSHEPKSKPVYKAQKPNYSAPQGNAPSGKYRAQEHHHAASNPVHTYKSPKDVPIYKPKQKNESLSASYRKPSYTPKNKPATGSRPEEVKQTYHVPSKAKHHPKQHPGKPIYREPTKENKPHQGVPQYKEKKIIRQKGPSYKSLPKPLYLSSNGGQQSYKPPIHSTAFRGPPRKPLYKQRAPQSRPAYNAPAQIPQSASKPAYEARIPNKPAYSASQQKTTYALPNVPSSPSYEPPVKSHRPSYLQQNTHGDLKSAYKTPNPHKPVYKSPAKQKPTYNTSRYPKEPAYTASKTPAYKQQGPKKPSYHAPQVKPQSYRPGPAAGPLHRAPQPSRPSNRPSLKPKQKHQPHQEATKPIYRPNRPIYKTPHPSRPAYKPARPSYVKPPHVNHPAANQHSQKPPLPYTKKNTSKPVHQHASPSNTRPQSTRPQKPVYSAPAPPQYQRKQRRPASSYKSPRYEGPKGKPSVKKQSYRAGSHESPTYVPAPQAFHKAPIIIYQGVLPPVHVYEKPKGGAAASPQATYGPVRRSDTHVAESILSRVMTSGSPRRLNIITKIQPDEIPRKTTVVSSTLSNIDALSYSRANTSSSSILTPSPVSATDSVALDISNTIIGKDKSFETAVVGTSLSVGSGENIIIKRKGVVQDA